MLSSDGIDGDNAFCGLLCRAGLSLLCNNGKPGCTAPGGPGGAADLAALQSALRQRLLLDGSAVAAFIAGLRIYLDDPLKA